MEHLIMFNREQCGLHHPGNIVPTCASCNKRSKENDIYVSWEKHLRIVCDKLPSTEIEKRINKIKNHIKGYAYPDISKSEMDYIKQVANKLYRDVQDLVKKAD